MGDKVLGLEVAFFLFWVLVFLQWRFGFFLRSNGFSDGRWMKEVLL